MNCRDPWELGFTLWLQTPPHYMGTVEWRQRKGYNYDNFFHKGSRIQIKFNGSYGDSGLRGKLSVIQVTVNLPLTTDPLRSWNKKGKGGHFIVGAGCFLTL